MLTHHPTYQLSLPTCILLLINLVTLPFISAQTYLNYSSTWTETSGSCGFSGTCDHLDYTRTLVGDTVLNGKTYYKVITEGTLSIYDLWLDSIVSVEPYTGPVQFIREEQSRLLWYRPSVQDEIILADFDLEVGDTAVSTGCQSKRIVHHIDTVYLNNEPRRIFYFGPGNGASWPNKVLIEGVGCTAGLFTYPCSEIGIESGSSLSCFSQDDDLIVVDTSAACNTTGTHHPLADLPNDIHIFPNPAMDEIFIEVGSMDVKEVVITDMAGRVAYREEKGNFIGNRLRVNVQSLVPGVYVVSVVEGRGIWAGRFVRG